MTALLLLAASAGPAVAAAAIALLRPSGPTAARWAIRATAVAFVAALGVAITVGTNGPLAAVVEGADGSALVGLYADRVGAVLALLTSSVGLVVQSFAGRALQGDLRARRFFMLTALLTAATTSVALSATLGLLAVSWIVAGAAVASLLAHRAGWAPAVRAARRTRRSLLVGDAALAVAVVLVVVSVGEVDLRSSQLAAEALTRAELPGSVGNVLPSVAVLLTAAGVSRSALVPLHRWLPTTLAAPTPVSALLHAGVVNGAGVLLVRLAPLFGSSSAATHLAFAAGVVTTLYATSVMLVRSDVKGNLAWSTAGQMGFMTVQLAVGAFSAALFHIVGHGMYKAALFLGSGGAVSAHLRHRRRPVTRRGTPRVVRLLTGLLVPAGALLAAYLVVDPHLPVAADILVMVFAWATAARAADGWLRAAPFTPMLTVLLAAVATVVGIFAYVAGLALFEGFVAPALPAEVPAAVDPAVLVTTLVVIGLVVTGVWSAPGARGARLRDRTYALLLSTAAPTSAPSAQRRAKQVRSSGGLAPMPSADRTVLAPLRSPRQSR
jgi:NADH:ubiquinone oxidoreductase subunit 5 (subunit L)/multisubunit Na+/H+ antiporter MnhA subunit